MGKPVIGAQLYTLRDFQKTLPDFTEAMKKVAAIGYKTVQVSGVGVKDPKEIVEVADGEVGAGRGRVVGVSRQPEPEHIARGNIEQV